jgi:hypothetical protein
VLEEEMEKRKLQLETQLAQIKSEMEALANEAQTITHQLKAIHDYQTAMQAIPPIGDDIRR